MTDLLCESAKLDDWMKEVESTGTPETFQDDSPPNEEAGAHSCRPAAWAAAHILRPQKLLLSPQQMTPLSALPLWSQQMEKPCACTLGLHSRDERDAPVWRHGSTLRIEMVYCNS